MNKNYEAICRGEEIRANLIELKKTCKDPQVAAELLEGTIDPAVIASLLGDDDAKIRKNAALLIGELRAQEDAQALYEAYEVEKTRFVRSSYLTALKALDVSDYIDSLQERYEELLTYEPKEEERKHVTEERGLLQQLLAQSGVLKKHTFTGWKRRNDVIFTTERALREPLKKQLEAYSKNGIQTTVHPMGVMARTTELDTLCRLHSYRELLHALNVKKTLSGSPEDLAKALLSSNLIELLEDSHREAAPFYFRVELRGIMDAAEKAKLAKNLAQELEQKSGGKLQNSTTDYEVELRLARTKDGTFYPCVKFYTIPDNRFDWRKRTISASMHPSLAAAFIELARPYLTEDAVVLDALCGVGTFVIERNLRMKTYDNYAVDIFGEAIAGAKENAAAAGVDCNFIMKDFLEFSSKHHMTEIFADMPKRGRKTKEELDAFYAGCFCQFERLLAPRGHLFLYSGEEGFVKKNLRLHGDLTLLREYAIRPKEDGVFYVIEKR